VAVTAFYRESRHGTEHLEVGFDPDVRNPFVARLVELDGQASEVTLRLPGRIAGAARTNLMGEVLEELTSSFEHGESTLSIALRAREIATVMLDLELGRHVPRHLDAHRHVWATVHRGSERESG